MAKHPPRELWMAEGNCYGHPEWTNLFYPERGENEKAAAARDICLFCPVKQECLDYANRWGLNREVDGIMGGYTGRQRRRLLKEEQERGLDRVHDHSHRDDLAS